MGVVLLGLLAIAGCIGADIVEGEEQWRVAASSILAARRDAAVITKGDLMYIFGGITVGSPFGSSSFTTLNLLTGEWTEIPQRPVWPHGRYRALFSSHPGSNLMYLFGGKADKTLYSKDQQADLWVYNLSSGGWRELPSWATQDPYAPNTDANTECSLVETKNHLVFAGSDTGIHGYYYIFNKELEKWLQPGEDQRLAVEDPLFFTYPSRDHCCAAIVGGSSSNAEFPRQFMLWNETDKRWRDITTILTGDVPVGEEIWSAHLDDNLVAVIGDTEGKGTLASTMGVALFSGALMRWTRVVEHSLWPAPRAEFRVTSYKGKLLVIGGIRDGQLQEEILAFNPARCPQDCHGRSPCVHGNCVACEESEGVACEISTASEDNVVLVTALTIGLAVIVTVGGVALWRATRGWRTYRRLYNTARVAEDLAYRVSKMDLDALDYLFELDKPTRTQEAFIEIVKSLKHYRTFLPQSVLVVDQDTTGGSHDSPTSPGIAWSAEFPTTDKGSPSNLATGLRYKRGTVMQLCIASVDPKVSHLFVSQVLDSARRGDGIVISFSMNRALVSWNTHRHCSQSASMACRCAVDLRRTIDQPLGIGLATGNLMCGAIGDGATNTPVVSGWAVDIAYTLACLAHVIESSTLMTEATFDRISSEFSARPVDIVTCRSRFPVYHDQIESSICIFELADDVEWQHEGLYLEAFMAFQRGEYQDAIDRFSSLITLNDREGSPRDLQAIRLLRLSLLCQKRGQTTYSRQIAFWDDIETELEAVSLPSDLRLSHSDRPHRSPSVANKSMGNDEGIQQLQEMLHSHSPVKVRSLPTSFVDLQGQKWYRSSKQIGSGGHGAVWLGMAADGGLAAIKAIPLQSTRDQSKVEKEAMLLARLRDENIVTYYGVTVAGNFATLVMEMMPGGSLASLIKQFRKIPLSSSARYTKDICKGLRYLHDQGIVHCDLKPGNVLLQIDGQCKLADFGSSECREVFDQKAIIGTPLYMAPEAAQGSYSTKVDIWGVGITVCEMICGRVPYVALDIPAQQFVRMLGRGKLLPVIPDSLPPTALRFITNCLAVSPDSRPTAATLLMDPFFLESKCLIDELATT